MKSLTKKDLFIEGHWVPTEKRFAVTNPATGETISEVADADAELTERAINVAEQAFSSWSKTPTQERVKLLRKWYQAMMDNQQALAEIMSAEQGKPVAEAAGEIAYGASFVDWFAGEAERINGDILPHTEAGKRVMVMKQPIGVCAAITPWNFPNAMITRKVAPALAAGCTIVVKPPQLTPLSALAIAQLASEVGIPDGVINIVPSTDAKTVGKILAESPKVRKLSFTGSTDVGKVLMSQCASNVKKISLELGGNAPFLVFDDADLDEAVEQLIACKFRNAGQTCISANRVLVQASVADKFIEKLKPAISKLKLGVGTDDVDLGPLVNQDAVDKVNRLVKSAVDNGAEVVLGGKVDSDLGELFYQPTLLTGVTGEMEISEEEIFGPVVAVSTFDDEQQGIERANDTPFGLASYFCSRSVDRIFRVSEALEYGMVGINAGGISHAFNPFGGVKESGIGREGSKYGIDEYLEIKTVTLGGL
ncbi:succinate-semialdehyde dehydrogenase (NADP(+)) [Idiomarina tyrosinivorans]|uniref:Succinate-semialdehyde dehydrogenase (NADP(+)) n=2 Tax=Idiomarina tyrosinivorans TaxID=1445662 RepID=A0A432ZJP4_9GAMM|nr:succinate-semialdehyde dehydrogenase (NADP(+)) [Idiomarina tyrosinivorans]